MILLDFLALPDIEDSPAWEFINQVPVQKIIPTLFRSRIQKRLLMIIDQAAQGYEALPELRCILPNSSVVPDVSNIDKKRLPPNNQPIGSGDGILERSTFRNFTG